MGVNLKTIQPFIDIGFHTVPLKGKLERLENSTKKTVPEFEKNWKSKYQTEFNEKPSLLGGTITGAISDIIAIDCDDRHTYELFTSLDPSYEFRFISKGKDGGTIIYRYPKDCAFHSFSIQSSILRLDFYSDNGFVYLPSDANKTKQHWPQEEFRALPDLSNAPNSVLTLLTTLQYQSSLTTPKKDERTRVKIRASYLAPQLSLFLEKKAFIPSLFKIITPKDFRQLPQYIKFSYLHPTNVPDGRGSEYLSKISAILGADASVNKAQYVDSMKIINGLWDSPMDSARLFKTVIEPMVEGHAAIDGEAIWSYDEHWQEHGLAFTTKLGEAAEVFYDDIRGEYFYVNYTSDVIRHFVREGELFNYIEPVAVALPPRKEVKTMCPIVRTSMKPELQFGFFYDDKYTKEFNVFRQSASLAILTNPKPYATLYKRPETILTFFKTLVPNGIMRQYLLSFIRTKLTTFKYSPVILYLIGAHGSGKDTLVNILSSILGSTYIARPSAKEFIEPYNGWLVDKYFVQLDEYGDQLATVSDKDEARGKIKAYTGKPVVQIRQMRTDGYMYTHSATFISTANRSPLVIEDGDRRICYLNTPNKLKSAFSSMAEALDKIEVEIQDFCYYLAVEVVNLTPDEYCTPPETPEKNELIASLLPAAQKLAFYLKNDMLTYIRDLADECGCAKLFNHTAENKIYEDDILELYMYMTDNMGSQRGLTKVLKDHGFSKVATTQEGRKTYYYSIANLYLYKPEFDNEE